MAKADPITGTNPFNQDWKGAARLRRRHPPPAASSLEYKYATDGMAGGKTAGGINALAMHRLNTKWPVCASLHERGDYFHANQMIQF